MHGILSPFPGVMLERCRLSETLHVIVPRQEVRADSNKVAQLQALIEVLYTHHVFRMHRSL